VEDRSPGAWLVGGTGPTGWLGADGTGTVGQQEQVKVTQIKFLDEQIEIHECLGR
jgi:hypothetical protein